MPQPLKYLQTSLTGFNPAERHKCKQPCKQPANRRLFGFFDPRNAKPSVCKDVDSYETEAFVWNKSLVQPYKF